MRRRASRTPTVGGLARIPGVLDALLELVDVVNPTAGQIARDARRFVELGERARRELEKLEHVDWSSFNGRVPTLEQLEQLGVSGKRTDPSEAETLCGFCGVPWTATHDCRSRRTQPRKR